MSQPISRDVFEELFVLELANNHLGNVERGIRIVREFGAIARYSNVRAAIKIQLRDIDTFIHKDFRDRTDLRYVKKTLDTRLSKEDLALLVEEIRKNNCIRMATPFDEASVDLCQELGIELIKLASSDINDWILIEKIAKAHKPVIASSGGASLKDTDDLVTFFHRRGIPLALNHCVSLYPSEDEELDLNQIDFLRNRYPTTTIGYSTHEYQDWSTSISIAYAKGARTFERHIDLPEPGYKVSPYCSTPEQIGHWFHAFKRAKAMCGPPGTQRRHPPRREIAYLDALVRGAYAAKDLPVGHILCEADVYLAVPLLKGQLSCREIIVGTTMTSPITKDSPLTLDHVDNAYSRSPELRAFIETRGQSA